MLAVEIKTSKSFLEAFNCKIEYKRCTFVVLIVLNCELETLNCFKDTCY